MVFVTGGTGLVGLYILRKLVSEGHQVRALHRKNSDLSVLADIRDKIEWVEGDIMDVTALAEYIQEADYVIHAGAIVSFAPRERQQMYQVNVEGTANIVNICLQFPVKKLLFVSSIASLGRTKEQLTMDEESKWIESDLNTHYASTKYLAEMEVRRGISEGLQAVIINPSVVLGASDWEKSSTRLFKYVWEQKPFYPLGAINYVDVRDVADIAVNLLFSEIHDERFIINGGQTTYLNLLSQMAASFGKRPPKYKVTPWIAELAWRLAYLQSLFTGKAPFITRESVRVADKAFYYENDKIKNALNFRFRALEDTIQWACEQLKANTDLPQSAK